jgi:hypothetical protein
MTANTGAAAATPAERWPDLPQLPIFSRDYQDDPYRMFREARTTGSRRGFSDHQVPGCTPRCRS